MAGGAGLVAVAVGAYFGASALSEMNQARADCASPACGDPAGVSASQAAVRDADISDVCIGVGVVAIAVGVYLALTSHPRQGDPAPHTAFAPHLGTNGAAGSLELVW
jgi:hypothetical protein